MASGRGRVSQFSLMVGPLINQPPPEQAPTPRAVSQHKLNSADLRERKWEQERKEGRERKREHEVGRVGRWEKLGDMINMIKIY